MKPRLAYALALASIVILAVALRFAHLGWGLRHVPHSDEQVFVENSAFLVTHRTLDHRYYEYPGLIFYLSAIALAVKGTSVPAGPGDYLLVRGVMAGSGVLSVFLVAVLGRRLLGPGGSLAAALLLAVSPVEVRVAHTLHPDVMLETFALLALLALQGIGPRLAGDGRAGAVLGTATAVKFSGLLLLPSYLLKRALEPGPRAWGLVLAGSSAVAAFFLLTPYALLHAQDFREGATTQWSYHYEGAPVGVAYSGMVQTYWRVLVEAFGPALVLAVGLLTFLRRHWREWAPVLLYPVVTVLIFSTSPVRHERFLVPAFGVVALVCGAGVEAAARRHATAATVLAVVSAAAPLLASLHYLGAVGEPIVRDRVVDWLATHAPEGARILSHDPALGIDRERFDVYLPRNLSEPDRWLEPNVDFLVTGPEVPESLDRKLVFRADPWTKEHGPSLAVYSVGGSTEPVPLVASELRASEQEDQLPASLDARLDTAWATAGAQKPGDFLEVRLPAPRRIGSIELRLGTLPQLWGRHLTVYASSGKDDLRLLGSALSALSVGRSLERQVPAQMFAFEAVCADRLRIVQEGRSGRRWAVAELRLRAAARLDPLALPCPGAR